MSIIDTTEELEAFCLRAANYPYVTIDTEFMRDKTYYAKLCLIQIAFPEKGEDSYALIDPLSEKLSLKPFFDINFLSTLLGKKGHPFQHNQFE